MGFGEHARHKGNPDEYGDPVFLYGFGDNLTIEPGQGVKRGACSQARHHTSHEAIDVRKWGDAKESVLGGDL
jgi:hypothetical protein